MAKDILAGRASKILIVEDDRLLRQQIEWYFKNDYLVCQASDRDEGMEIALKERPDLVLLDLHLSAGRGSPEGIGLLEEIHRRGIDSMVIVMTGDEKKECAFRAIEEGAYDFFRKPVDLAELRLSIRRALEKQKIERENRHLKERLLERTSFEEIIGTSSAIRKVFDSIRRVAVGDTTVIIRGESGTGKELVARAIHRTSDRKDGPFVPVQCSALPEHLVESELFGHEKGAYTDAVCLRQGRFEMAHRGTLFLDEIGTMSLAMQAKLLRVLEQKEFERIGGKQTIRVDVRLLTATNEDLEARMAEGSFREDLYYRFNVFPISLPPLRERTEDIPLLVDHFLKVFCMIRKMPPKKMAREALECLVRSPWKGNVRELENLIQKLVLQTDGDWIQASDLPPHFRELSAAEIRRSYDLQGERVSLPKEIERFEAQLLTLALDKAGWVKVEAARLLGIDKNRMMYLCRKHNLLGRLRPASPPQVEASDSPNGGRVRTVRRKPSSLVGRLNH